MCIHYFMLCRFPANSVTACSDLGDIRSHDPARRKALASEVRDACMRVGFFYGPYATRLMGPKRSANPCQ